MTNKIMALAILVMAMIVGDLAFHDGEIAGQVVRELNRLL